MRLETQFRRCDLCREPDAARRGGAVTECQLCGRDLCAGHSEPLRLLPGMGCAVCQAYKPCVVCEGSARNRCTGCGAALCRLHTQELCGRISCPACLYGPIPGRPWPRPG